MANNLMNRCESRGGNNGDWTIAMASDLESGTTPNIRCLHCHGAVRVHRRHGPHGPTDHVEHLSRQDSNGCLGGHHFDGEHRMSLVPVV